MKVSPVAVPFSPNWDELTHISGAFDPENGRCNHGAHGRTRKGAVASQESDTPGGENDTKCSPIIPMLWPMGRRPVLTARRRSEWASISEMHRVVSKSNGSGLRTGWPPEGRRSRAASRANSPPRGKENGQNELCDRLRLGIYHAASKAYARAVHRALKAETMALAARHKFLVQHAESRLPRAPMEDYGWDRLIREARSETAIGLDPKLLECLPAVSGPIVSRLLREYERCSDFA